MRGVVDDKSHQGIFLREYFKILVKIWSNLGFAREIFDQKWAKIQAGGNLKRNGQKKDRGKHMLTLSLFFLVVPFTVTTKFVF